MAHEQLIHLKTDLRFTLTSLQLALDSFLLDAEARRLTPKTIRYYRQQIQPFLDSLSTQGVITPEAITAHHIRRHMVEMQRRGLADASIHASARAIRAFCNFMVREELLDKSPMRKVQMPRVEQRILPAFTPVEVQRLLAFCENDRDKAIVLCLLDTGCRVSEFVALDVGDVDIHSGKVLVRQGKGRKQRVAFLGSRARKALLKYFMVRGGVQADGPLWPNLNTSKRLTDSGLRLMLRRLGRRAEVDHCNPHTFRRSFALWSLRAGMNIYALQQIMGHSDLSILRRYLALVEEDLHDAHQKHGAVDNML